MRQRSPPSPPRRTRPPVGLALVSLQVDERPGLRAFRPSVLRLARVARLRDRLATGVVEPVVREERVSGRPDGRVQRL